MPLKKGDKVYIINEDRKPEEVKYSGSCQVFGGLTQYLFTDEMTMRCGYPNDNSDDVNGKYCAIL